MGAATTQSDFLLLTRHFAAAVKSQRTTRRCFGLLGFEMKAGNLGGILLTSAHLLQRSELSCVILTAILAARLPPLHPTAITLHTEVSRAALHKTQPKLLTTGLFRGLTCTVPETPSHWV